MTNYSEKIALNYDEVNVKPVPSSDLYEHWHACEAENINHVLYNMYSKNYGSERHEMVACLRKLGISCYYKLKYLHANLI